MNEATIKRQTLVEEQMLRLAFEIDVLEKNIAQLDEECRPLLMTTPDTSKQPEVVVPEVVFASRIFDQNQRLSKINVYLGVFHNRLEL